jgi:hypothetical protein
MLPLIKAYLRAYPPPNSLLGALTTMDPDWRQIEQENRGLSIRMDQIGVILDGKGLALKGREDEAWLRLKQLLRRCP